MKARCFAAFYLVLAVQVLPHPALTADPHPADPDLPQPFNPAELTPLIQHSPFNRVVDFEQTYALTGIARVDGKNVATLFNTATKQRFLVTEEVNAQGWRLAEVSAAADPKQAAVKLLVGGEEVVLRYTDVAALQNSRSSSSSSSGRRREVTPVDIHKLSPSDFIRHDENGKPYVRGSIYLPTADREYYYNQMSREAHDRFLNIMRDNRERMFSASPDERASMAKRVFDQVNSEDRSRQR